jgi:hypothetical protein
MDQSIDVRKLINDVSECRRIFMDISTLGESLVKDEYEPHDFMEKMSDEENQRKKKPICLCLGKENEKVEGVKMRGSRRLSMVVIMFFLLSKKKCGNNCNIIWMNVFVNKLW